MFDKEAYLLAKIKSSEKNFAIKSSIFFPKTYLNETHFELIDDKLLYGTVDWRW